MSEQSGQLAVIERNADLALAEGAKEAEATACHLAREFQEATGELRRLLAAVKAQTDRLDAAFSRQGEAYHCNHFELSLSVSGHRHVRPEAPDEIFSSYNRDAWRVLVNVLGIKNVMSIKKREEFDKQLEAGGLPAITEENILGVLFGLAERARDFAREAAVEVLAMLKPQRGYGAEYKTNSSYKVGRRVILTGQVERGYGNEKFRPNHYHEKRLVALDGVFHLLDGKGVMREHLGPLVQAIKASPDGKGATEYFRFKCFKNGNLHIEFLKLELVKQLNGLAAGEYTLGDDPE